MPTLRQEAFPSTASLPASDLTGVLPCEVQLDIRLPNKSSTVVMALVPALLNCGGENWDHEGGAPFRG